MKIRNRNLVLALSAFAALSFTASAHAQSTETFTASIGPNLTDFTQKLKLQKFNPSLGTLESISLDYVLTSSATGTVTNTNATKTKTPTVTDTVTSSLLDFSVAAPMVQTYSLAPGQSKPFTNSDTAGVTVTYTSSNANFASFIGAGLTNFDVKTKGKVTTTDNGNTATNISTTASGFATVVYTYDPIPEASTLLGFSALLGMGVIRLRRRSTKA